MASGDEARENRAGAFREVGEGGDGAFRAERVGEAWMWRPQGSGGSAPAAEMLFAGRGAPHDRPDAVARLAPGASAPAWLRQVHSARVVAVSRGEAGERGEGDAMVVSAPGVCLTVVTADCVPVLLAGPQGLAAVHAGWRGIAAGVVAATLDHISRHLLAEAGARGEGLGGQGDGPAARCGSGSSRDDARAGSRLAGWTAWIGPAIGGCCYEVGDDVAAAVVAASGPDVASPGPRGRSHLDLQEAVRLQLACGGVNNVHILALCTRCAGDRLHSYRREGRGAGRNLALIWRQ